jgi:hypothetical protein
MAPLRLVLLLMASLAATSGAFAQSGFGSIRLDQWGIFQKNINGSEQWQYRPRVYIPYKLENAWTLTLRADAPMLYTNASGPGNPGGGYSGGIGNVFLEPIIDTPEVAPNLTLRASLRLVAPSPKKSPFGNDTQSQAAPGAGFVYKMADALNGVTVVPYLRYFHGFDVRYPGTTLVSSVNLFPTVTFGLNDRWSLTLYPENPITYNRINGSWFVPLDFLFVNRLSKNSEIGIGGAFKLNNPVNPSYDYIISGRATFFF